MLWCAVRWGGQRNAAARFARYLEPNLTKREALEGESLVALLSPGAPAVLCPLPGRVLRKYRYRPASPTPS